MEVRLKTPFVAQCCNTHAHAFVDAFGLRDVLVLQAPYVIAVEEDVPDFINDHAAVLVAEVVKTFQSRLVELHNYRCMSARKLVSRTGIAFTYVILFYPWAFGC